MSKYLVDVELVFTLPIEVAEAQGFDDAVEKAEDTVQKVRYSAADAVKDAHGVEYISDILVRGVSASRV